VDYRPGATDRREPLQPAVAVTDEGDGIAREHLPRLTERFYRVDTARSRELGGTGLGLAIVKHILNRHRGALDIDSTVGVGSSFMVHLPIAARGRAAGGGRGLIDANSSSGRLGERRCSITVDEQLVGITTAVA